MDTGSVSFAYKIPYVESVIVIDGAEIPMDFIEYLELNKEVDYYINYGNYIEKGKITPTKETNHYEFPMNKLEYNPDIELVTIKVNILDGDEEDVTVRVYPLQLTEILTGVSAELIPVIEITNGSVLVPENGIWIVMIDIKDKATISNEIQTAGEDVEIDISTGTSPNTKPPEETSKLVIQVNSNPPGAKMHVANNKGEWIAVPDSGLMDAEFTKKMGYTKGGMYPIKATKDDYYNYKNYMRVYSDSYNIWDITLVPILPETPSTVDNIHPKDNSPTLKRNSVYLIPNEYLTNRKKVKSVLGVSLSHDIGTSSSKILSVKNKDNISFWLDGCLKHDENDDYLVVAKADGITDECIISLNSEDSGGGEHSAIPLYFNFGSMFYNYATPDSYKSNYNSISVDIDRDNFTPSEFGLHYINSSVTSYNINGDSKTATFNNMREVNVGCGTVIINSEFEDTNGKKYNFSGPINIPLTVPYDSSSMFSAEATDNIISINPDYVAVDFKLPSSIFNGITSCKISMVTTSDVRKGPVFISTFTKDIIEYSSNPNKIELDMNNFTFSTQLRKNTAFDYMILCEMRDDSLKSTYGVLHGSSSGCSKHGDVISPIASNFIIKPITSNFEKPTGVAKVDNLVLYMPTDLNKSMIAGAYIEYDIKGKKYISDGPLICLNADDLGSPKVTGSDYSAVEKSGTTTKIILGSNVYTGSFMARAGHAYNQSAAFGEFVKGDIGFNKMSIFQSRVPIKPKTKKLSVSLGSDVEIYLYPPEVMAVNILTNKVLASNCTGLNLVERYTNGVEKQIQDNETVCLLIHKHGYLPIFKFIRPMSYDGNDITVEISGLSFTRIDDIRLPSINMSGLEWVKVDVVSNTASNEMFKAILPYSADLVVDSAGYEVEVPKGGNYYLVRSGILNSDIGDETLLYPIQLQNTVNNTNIHAQFDSSKMINTINFIPVGGTSNNRKVLVRSRRTNKSKEVTLSSIKNTIQFRAFTDDTIIELYDGNDLILKEPLYINNAVTDIYVKTPSKPKKKIKIVPLNNHLKGYILWKQPDPFIVPYYKDSEMNEYTKVTDASLGYDDEEFIYANNGDIINIILCVNGYKMYKTTITISDNTVFDINNHINSLVKAPPVRYYIPELFASHYATISVTNTTGFDKYTNVNSLPIVENISNAVSYLVNYSTKEISSFNVFKDHDTEGRLFDNKLILRNPSIFGNAFYSDYRTYSSFNNMEFGIKIGNHGNPYKSSSMITSVYSKPNALSTFGTISGLQLFSNTVTNTSEVDGDYITQVAAGVGLFSQNTINTIYFDNDNIDNTNPRILSYTDDNSAKLYIDGDIGGRISMRIDKYSDKGVLEDKIKLNTSPMFLFDENASDKLLQLKPSQFFNNYYDKSITLKRIGTAQSDEELRVGDIILDSSSPETMVFNSSDIASNIFRIGDSTSSIIVSASDTATIYYTLPNKAYKFILISKSLQQTNVLTYNETRYTIAEILYKNEDSFGITNNQNVPPIYSGGNTSVDCNILVKTFPATITGFMRLYSKSTYYYAEFTLKIEAKDILNNEWIPPNDNPFVITKIEELGESTAPVITHPEIASGLYDVEYTEDDWSTVHILTDKYKKSTNTNLKVRYKDKVSGAVSLKTAGRLVDSAIIHSIKTDRDSLGPYYTSRKSYITIKSTDRKMESVTIKPIRSQTQDNFVDMDLSSNGTSAGVSLLYGAYFVFIEFENDIYVALPVIVNKPNVDINVNDMEKPIIEEKITGTLTIKLEGTSSGENPTHIIYGNGKSSNVSNLSPNTLEVGDYALRTTLSGYETRTDNVTITKDTNTEVIVQLKKVDIGDILNKVYVTLTPNDAVLLMEIDGIFRRVLPNRSILLKTGKYRYKVTHSKYNTKEDIFVVTDNTTSFDAKLDPADIKKHNVSFRLVEPKHGVKTYIGIVKDYKYDLVETSEMVVPHESIIYVKMEAQGYETDGYYMNIDEDTVIDVNMSRGKGDIRCINIPPHMDVKFRYINDDKYIWVNKDYGIAKAVQKGKVYMYVQYDIFINENAFNKIYKEKEVIIDHLGDPTLIDIGKEMESEIIYGSVNITSNITKIELSGTDAYSRGRTYPNLKLGINKIPIGKYNIRGKALDGGDYLFDDYSNPVFIEEGKTTKTHFAFTKESDLELNLTIKIEALNSTIKKYDKYKWKVEYKENNSNTWVWYDTVEGDGNVVFVKLPKKKAGTIWTIRITDDSTDKVYNETIDTATWHKDNYKVFLMFQQMNSIELVNPTKFHPRYPISLSYGDKEYEYYYDRFGYDFDEIRKFAYYRPEEGVYKYLPNLPYLTLLASRTNSFDICNHIPHFHGTIHGNSIHHDISGSKAVLNIAHFSSDLLSKAPRQPMRCNLEGVYVPDYELNGTIYNVKITRTTHQYFDVISNDITERHGLAHKQTPVTFNLVKKGNLSLPAIDVGVAYSGESPYSFEIEITNVQTKKLMYIGKTSPVQVIDFVTTDKSKWMQLKGATFNERNMYKININGFSLASDEKIYLYSVYDTGEMMEVIGSNLKKVKSIWKQIDTNYPSNDKLSGFIHTTKYATFMYVKDGHKPLQIVIDISSKIKALYRDDYNIRINFSEISAKIEDTVLQKYTEYLTIDFSKTTDIDSFMFYYDTNEDELVNRFNAGNDVRKQVYDLKGLVMPVSTEGKNNVYRVPRIRITGAINMTFRVPVHNIQSIMGDVFVMSMKNISRLGVSQSDTPTNNGTYVTDYRVESMGRSYEYKIDVQIREVVDGRVKKYRYEDDTSDGVMFGTYVFADNSYIIVKFPKGRSIRYFRSTWVTGLVLRYFRDGYTSPVTVIDRVTGIPPSATVEIAMPQMIKLDQI